MLQNLFGEGVLSASLIPVYTRLRAEGREEEARQVAGAVAGLLAAVMTAFVALGVTATPLFVDAIAPGFSGARRDLTVTLVRILFPGVGFLVLSAWCLGILNSHRQFFLSYAAPVIWNLAIIAATLLPGGGLPRERLILWTAWGAMTGSILQFAVQLPRVWRLTGGVRLSLRLHQPQVGTVLRNFLPAFTSRGVVQISAFIDVVIASLLPTGAVAALSNAQLLYTLPISLFGMSVAAAELPELSEAAGQGGASAGALRARLEAGAAQVAYFIVPSAVAFFALGQVVAGLVFQSGAFTRDDARYVWGVLAGATVGLLASALGRLLSSAYYALHDTRTPLRFALLRVALTVTLGFLAAVYLPGLLGLDRRWGAAGLTATAGAAGWVEFLLLRRALTRRIGPIPLDLGLLARLWAAALAAAAVGWLALGLAGSLHPMLTGLLVLGVYGAAYLAGTRALRVPLAGELLRRAGIAP